MACTVNFSALILIAAVNACAGETNVTDGLHQTTQILKKQYCPASGGPVLKVRLLLTVKNSSASPVILTRAALVQEYDIRRMSTERSRKPPLSAQTLPEKEPFSATTLDLARPPADLFDIIAPGASVDRIVLVALWVKDLQVTMEVPSATYWLSVRVKYWPWSQVAASEARQRWSRFGTLWTRPVVAGPVELPVERDPMIERCIDRID